MKAINVILTIAYRDLTKFVRDRSRIIASLIFPFVFIGALGGGLQANLGKQAGYNFLIFVFTGVLAQTLFQSTASGIISLIEDRENDFSQELFVSPVSRYVIVLGKIIGETLVSLAQAVGVIIFGFLVGVPFEIGIFVRLFPAMLVACILGGAFGLLVLSNLSNQRAANQVFPFLILPQFFLAGVFSPIKNLPPYLWILSRIAPMTYAVDFIRNLFYVGKPEYSKVILYPLWVDILIIGSLFSIFLITGTIMFIRNERNR